MNPHGFLRRVLGGHHGPAGHGEHGTGSAVLLGRHAALYDRVATRALGWLYRTVADRVLAGVPRGGDVLDVGTGPGQLLVELARRRPDVHAVGVDPSVDMVGHATRRAARAGLTGQVEARVGAAEALPFADGSFDVVVSSLSAHHWADPSAGIAEQARVLRPGGQLWIFDLRGESPATLPAALAASFPAAAVTQPRLGRLASAFVVAARAVKPTRAT